MSGNSVDNAPARAVGFGVTGPVAGGDAGAALPVSMVATILMVDDDPSMHAATRLMIRRLTVPEGYSLSVREALRGDDSVEIVKREIGQGPLFILMDVVMETDNAGILAARRIRAEARRPDAVIVLRTGQAGKLSDIEAASLEGIDGYILKSTRTAREVVQEIEDGLKMAVIRNLAACA